MHACTHAHTLSQGLKLKQPNIPRLDTEKKEMRTELSITTVKELVQKVTTIDLKSVTEHFRAASVHISWQLRLLSPM